MNNINFVAFISLMIRMISLGVILFYIIPKQFREVLRPYDWLTRLRLQIFVLLVFSITAALPYITYQAIRTVGGESEILRGVAGVSSNLSILGVTTLLVLVYNYKKPEE